MIQETLTIQDCEVRITPLTCENGGHESAEQDEHEREEELARVVVDVFGLVPDVVVQDADQEAEQDVRYETGHR